MVKTEYRELLIGKTSRGGEIQFDFCNSQTKKIPMINIFIEWK